MVASGSEGVCATLASRAARCSRVQSSASRCASAAWKAVLAAESDERSDAATPSRCRQGWRPSTCARASVSIAAPSRCTSCLSSSLSWSISTTGSLKSDVPLDSRSSRPMRSRAVCSSRPIALAATDRSERGGFRRRGGWPLHSLSAIAKNSAVRSTRPPAARISSTVLQRCSRWRRRTAGRSETWQRARARQAVSFDQDRTVRLLAISKWLHSAQLIASTHSSAAHVRWPRSPGARRPRRVAGRPRPARRRHASRARRAARTPRRRRGRRTNRG